MADLRGTVLRAPLPGASTAALPAARFWNWSTLPGYWPRAPILAMILFTIVAIRVQELFPATGVLRPLLVVSIVGIVLLFRGPYALGRRSALDERLGRLFIAYFVWAIVTVPFAIWKAPSVDATRALFAAVLLGMSVLMCSPVRPVAERLLHWLVALIGAFMLYGLVFGGYWEGRLRFSGSFDPNDIAALVGVGFPLAVGTFVRNRGRMRVIAGLCAVVLVLTEVAANSRGGIIAFGVGGLVLLIGLRGLSKITISTLLAVGLFATWMTASQDFRWRMLSFANLETDYNMVSSTGRKAIWTRAITYATDNPVFGVGIANFPMAEGAYWSTIGTTGKWSTAHNAYLQAFVEMGVPGGLIFVGILLTAGATAARFYRGRRLPDGRLDHRPEFLASVMAFATSALFLSHAYFPMLFGLAALIVLFDRVVRVEWATATGAGLVRSTDTAPAAVQRTGERGGLAYYA